MVTELTKLLDGKVGDTFVGQALENAKQEAARRIHDKIPPGYKDHDKTPDEACGDYFVWEQTLVEASKRKTDVLFITGDDKEDWWRKKKGRTLGPRLELVDEFRARTGCRLFMMRPEVFLKAAREVLDVSVSDESVNDAQRVGRHSSLRDAGGWDSDGVRALLVRLEREAPVQFEALLVAAQQDGRVGRSQVYAIGKYSDERTLRGFTRPVRRITSELKGTGVVDAEAIDILQTEYNAEESYVQASGFFIPEEVLPLVESEVQWLDF